MAKNKHTISLEDSTWERLQYYAEENHFASVSAALEQIAWKLKVSNNQVRGQMSLK